jgi:hypothetical protein
MAPLSMYYVSYLDSPQGAMQQKAQDSAKGCAILYRLADMHTPPQGLELSLVRKGQIILNLPVHHKKLDAASRSYAS